MPKENLVKDLLKRNAELELELYKIRNEKQIGSSSVNISSLISEINGKNNMRIRDIKVFIESISRIDKLTDLYNEAMQVIEMIFNCRATLYIPEDYDIPESYVRCNDLRDKLIRVYGDVDIFEVYANYSLRAIHGLKMLASNENKENIVGKESIGAYIRSPRNDIHGFIFLDSQTALDRDVFEIILEFYSNYIERVKSLSLVMAANRKFQNELSIDELTEVSTRKRYNNDLNDEIYKHLAFIDIDRFKGINDNYGHDTGDLVLKELGDSLNSVFNKEGCRAYRQGGDEFAVMSNRDETEFIEMLEKLRKHFYNKHNANKYNITLSIGVCLNKTDIKLRTNWADYYLYEVKNNGKDGIKYGNGRDEYVDVMKEKRLYDN